MSLTERFPSLAYVAPFATFVALLWLGPKLGLAPWAEAAVRVGILVGVILVFSRGVLTFGLTRPAGSFGIGVLVFIFWVAPDLLVPGWHHSRIFSNGIFGTFETSTPVAGMTDPVFLAFRSMRAIILVPIIEELFWRAWLPRWFDDMDDFRRVPLGTYSRAAFWLTVVLFASEHGALWDVGLMAGIIYNEWMRRSRSLGDLILAHAVTNALLSGYVLMSGKWEYW